MQKTGLRTLVSTVAAALAVSAVHADATGWWTHVRALADDSMEGRATGTPGYRRAAEYVAAEFEKAGLEPAGANGFMQPVAFKTRRIDEAHSSLTLVRGDKTEPLVLGEDANFSMHVDPAPALDAPLVFVGYGFKIPEMSYDDLDDPAIKAGLRNSVAVYLAGSPPEMPAPLRAHYQASGARWAALNEAGVIGTIGIPNPRGMEIPWARATLARLQPAMTLAEPDLDEAAGQQLAVTMNPAHADKLFAGTGHTLRELLALAEAGKRLPRFSLSARVKANISVQRAEVESPNIVGLLRGADQRLRDEYVVLSAHLDHLGVGVPTGGANSDHIYNGAMDNAAGTAAIIEVAARLHETGQRPARSILFTAVAGEEKGELGSRHFVAHATVPSSAIVANLNTDMFLPLFPLKTLMVLGLDESDLGDDIRAVAAERGLAVQADPEPERNRFIRSDQYSFVVAGIPALAMKVGYEARTPEAEIARRWTAERYHAPSDDLSQSIDMTAGGEFVEVLRALAVRVANRPDRPRWNDASFFKRFAAPRH